MYLCRHVGATGMSELVSDVQGKNALASLSGCPANSGPVNFGSEKS